MSSAATHSSENAVYGLLAEFDSPQALVAAAEKALAQGFRRMDGFSPFPVEGLSEAVGFKRTKLPLLVLLGGIFGFLGGYGLLYFTTVIDYPINIGGRPLHSIPSFIPISYECTILLASLTAALGMLALNGLPKPYHPVFNVAEFAKASSHGFFLLVESKDPKFDLSQTKTFLESLKPEGVYEVPA